MHSMLHGYRRIKRPTLTASIDRVRISVRGRQSVTKSKRGQGGKTTDLAAACLPQQDRQQRSTARCSVESWRNASVTTHDCRICSLSSAVPLSGCISDRLRTRPPRPARIDHEVAGNGEQPRA